jgi:hypothetical protein
MQVRSRYCAACARWWAWPATMAYETDIPACPICRGDQDLRATCRQCGTMLSEGFIQEGTTNRCTICGHNTPSAEELINYTTYVLGTIEEPKRAMRCRCNRCGG